MQFCRE